MNNNELRNELAARFATYNEQIAKGWPPCEVNIRLIEKLEAKLAEG